MRDSRTHTPSIAVAVLVFCAISATAQADFTSSIEALNPLAYWRLGESSGATASDSSGFGRDGTYHNVSLGTQGSLFGDTDTAVSYRRHGYVDVDHDSAMLMDNGTVQFRFMDTGSIRTAGLFSKDSSGYDHGGHLTVMIDNGKVRTRLQSKTASYDVWSDEIGLDTWYMVTFTFGDDGMKLYMDDLLVDTNPYTGGLGTTSGGTGNTEPIAMGANTWASGNGTVKYLRDYFSGTMDEVVLFDYALSLETISDLHEIGSTGVPEPATLSVLLLGALAVVRKRRRPRPVR
ncbi:MAG: PEP-CTERM sorting domain-containing protein [Phycisphaerae bacterium]|nr:PEP-CTERM sorting domain-containing protein [Phycisphaerae bacterium]